MRKGKHQRKPQSMGDRSEHPISMTLNGKKVTLEAPPTMRLLDLLRERLFLTGTKEGCGKGECGACTVIMNGKAVDSCLVLACQANHATITTVEGLASERRLDPIQEAFIQEGASQCGFCIPGIIMAARVFLDHHPDPTLPEIQEALAGNLCRCTGYSKIFRAVLTAASMEKRD